MSTLEEIVSVIASLPAAQGERRFATSLVGERVYLARSPTGQHELFFRGTKESFEDIRLGRVLDWGEYQIAETGSLLPALVARTHGTESGRRLMAHVAYEGRRLLDEQPDLSNAELVRQLNSFLRLVLEQQVLSPAEQIGLMGELQLMDEILSEIAQNSDHRVATISSWCGPSGGLRDFQSRGIAIEVKASPSGEKHVVAMDQLLPTAEEERLFLCSVRVRRDSSAPLKLGEKVQRIEELLGEEDMVGAFREKLEKYGSFGFSQSDAGLYELEPGFFVERTVLREIDDGSLILRPSSFREGEPPASVSDVRYLLNSGFLEPVSKRIRRAVLGALVGRDENEG